MLYIPYIVFHCFSTGLMHDLTGFRKRFKSTTMEGVVGQKITYASQAGRWQRKRVQVRLKEKKYYLWPPAKQLC